LISGNDAIQHTVSDAMGMPWVTRLPLSYYWLPYGAKIFCFPHYSPAGTQVIKTLQDIPNDIPIIIIHSTQDFQLSHKGALALYHGLRANGNYNVYLIEKWGSQHLNLLENDEQTKEVVQAILENHNLKHVTHERAINLARYQPNHRERRFKKPYDDLNKKEAWHQRIWTTIKVGAILGIVAAIGFGIKKLTRAKKPAKDLSLKTKIKNIFSNWKLNGR